MTVTAPSAEVDPGLRSIRAIEHRCYVVGAALIAAGIVHLGIAMADSRPWSGPLSWRKPATFGVSFGITLIAITWASSHLRISARARRWLLVVFAADCILEVTGVTVQAWRNVPSHLNTETSFDAVVAYSLAAGGAVLIGVLGSMIVVAVRGQIDADPSMRLALRFGFALLLAGLVSGAAMIARGVRLREAGDTAAVYHDVGYLKWFHAVTLHAILVLPLLAWLLSRTDRSETQRTRVVAVVSGVYVVAAVAALVVSLNTM
jgi:hypothetical protein